MFPNALIKGHDKRRLRNLLTVIFLALAVPTAVLIWQGYSQLKWEAFHQYRGQAAELNRRIDSRLIDMINTADARSFADYTFLVVTGDANVNYLQRSPLSAYPVIKELPGVLGYFQVDSHGTFSSPLLPAQDSDPEKLGISTDEYINRLQLTQEIQSVLADNRLVRSRPESRTRQHAVISERLADMELAGMAIAVAEKGADGAAMNESEIDREVIDKTDAMPSELAGFRNKSYSQQVFDELNLPRQDKQLKAVDTVTADTDDAVAEPAIMQQRFYSVGKVADLKLNASLQKKSEQLERKAVQSPASHDLRDNAPARAKRKETSALPATVVSSGKEGAANAAKPADLHISTFESEIDPLEFSLLDSGHFVLYRKVWRDGERFIQGLLIDQQAFIEEVIDTPFMETTLSGMSDLIVAHQDDVIQSFSGRGSYQNPADSQVLEGALLYRNRLSAPLDSLELIFSIKRLPPGPGASVLGWTTIIIAVVFLGCFFFLYRLGLSQINVARQQQDFVSAVSHELKTPLTSIRMYGEMLKEGWADEEKRQTYYEYIHIESERLTRLISNVLQLANITHNEPAFDVRPFRIGELISKIESKIADQVAGAGFELTFSHSQETDRAYIRIDEDCFAQIIINLVDNAIKFSDKAGRKAIEINCRLTSNKQVLFAVRDYGPGVPKDQMKKIFQLFYRSESELTRETVGTGIGLAIVHQLTVAMNGKVDIINRDPGAEFRLTFSIEPEAAYSV
jgi:signal transduction histidine kinase